QPMPPHLFAIAEFRCRLIARIARVTAPTPYLHFAGTARDALNFYGGVFDCAVQLHTYAEFSRTDGPSDAIAHGYLLEGPVSLFAADVTGDEPAFRAEGMMLSLLGTSDPDTLRTWFSKLSEGGRVVDDLQRRAWGASDGQVVDRFGVHWLIGFEDDDTA
ncbi:MAG: VOC family protein, partial [Marmoricola sp.]